VAGPLRTCTGFLCRRRLESCHIRIRDESATSANAQTLTPSHRLHRGPPPPKPNPGGELCEPAPSVGAYSKADASLDVAKVFLETAPDYPKGGRDAEAHGNDYRRPEDGDEQTPASSWIESDPPPRPRVVDRVER
jgi:hypothetical protein